MNYKKGFIGIGAAAIIIVAMVAVGAAYYLGKKSNNVPVNYNPYVNSDTIANTNPVKSPVNTQQVSTTLPTTCVEKTEGMPVITSISKNTGSIGDRVEIKGCNFSGFEADKNVWIQNSNNEAGVMYGEKESTDQSIIFILKSPLCQTDNSYKGDECQKTLNLVPGAYKIFTNPWGKKSNEFSFTINSATTSSGTWKKVTINGVDVSYPGTWEIRNPISNDCQSINCESVSSGNGSMDYKLYDPKITTADKLYDKDAIYISTRFGDDVGYCEVAVVPCPVPSININPTTKTAIVKGTLLVQTYGANLQTTNIFDQIVSKLKKQYVTGISVISSTLTSLNVIPVNINTDDSHILGAIEGAKTQAANFNGHYSTIYIGCGTECASPALYDKNTGKLYYFNSIMVYGALGMDNMPDIISFDSSASSDTLTFKKKAADNSIYLEKWKFSGDTFTKVQ